jgi:phosphoglucomutase
MIDLYVQYGFYKEHLISITKKGMDGQQQIADMMESYRKNPPNHQWQTVVMLMDYQKQVKKNLQTGEEWKLELPKSNVLQFVLDDMTFISARPSGTEPKLNFIFR